VCGIDANHNDACTATGARRVVSLVVLAMVTQGAGIFVLVSVGVCISGCIR
jgi:hydrogenase maturation factor